jgi:hypothetical protein
MSEFPGKRQLSEDQPFLLPENNHNQTEKCSFWSASAQPQTQL